MHFNLPVPMFPILSDLGKILDYKKSKGTSGFDPKSDAGWDWGWRSDPISGLRSWHNGIDLGAAEGTPIYAPWDGVVHIWKDELNGNGMRITHSGVPGVAKTGYAHLQAYDDSICEGCTVKRGQKIAYVGNTGKSTGAHLHFTLWSDGTIVVDGESHSDANPMPYLEDAVEAASGKKKMTGVVLAGGILLASYFVYLALKK